MTAPFYAGLILGLAVGQDQPVDHLEIRLVLRRGLLLVFAQLAADGVLIPIFNTSSEEVCGLVNYDSVSHWGYSTYRGLADFLPRRLGASFERERMRSGR